MVGARWLRSVRHGELTPGAGHPRQLARAATRAADLAGLLPGEQLRSGRFHDGGRPDHEVPAGGHLRPGRPGTVRGQGLGARQRCDLVAGQGRGSSEATAGALRRRRRLLRDQIGRLIHQL